MLVLALDTTTRAGSCAVARDGAVVREEASNLSRPHSARLPGELMALLERARLPLDAIDVFAVATGPGSFTGLRVGIATMQGLAFAARRPLIGVSALDALARRAAGARPAAGGRIATWVDAWRGEVYAALYERGVEIDPPVVARPDALLERYAATGGTAEYLFIGDGAEVYRELIRTRLGAAIADPVAPMLAGTIAQMATEAHRAGGAPPPHAIRPLYVRRPDAELARDARAAR
ncbi:MAG TPA: tRNA (adenosine(37)-N6)-threonylcarbamoyltransferase complex dimerization subunit type 1 TsaB [Vicinamibacterales bacterium]|nr:tRNA (adenosine(37)-N6)-threonylcarbamoyltransferase complex dimerization subunit type 1 TsaB [Vicinamibacterales bacterium]